MIEALIDRRVGRNVGRGQGLNVLRTGSFQ